ncbi:MAG: hypothetical protein AB8B83_00610 [Bdellovibrionales bacterium]
MASILDVKDTQFRLGEDGVISFQAVESNPLAGERVAKLVKGETPLTPGIEISNAKGADEAALMTRLERWRDAHFASVLELLVGLKEPLKQPEAKEGEEAPAPLPSITETVQAILDAVYEAMGILPREQIESLIAQIDADDRRVLRAKRVRLGPILVFIPALNKPAGVRLRGLLWSLYNSEALPANVPNDGIVSQVVEVGSINADFYQSVGYPVFGNRAIRIDMLDRVICAVYDSADKGRFRAQHQMAEWLGCPIDDLYTILEAMGHKRIHVEKVPQADADTTEVGAEKIASDTTNDEATENKPDVKPELDEFLLKRGKAFEKKTQTSGRQSGDKSGVSKNFKKKQKPKGKRNKSEPRQPKVMSAEAKKIEDSPFAILQQLKTGNDD